MCLLTVMSPGATPTREQLMTAACNNPHGFGYAIMFEDRIVTGRGMDAQEVIDRFLAIRERCPDTWAMFHHRYTTHGTSTKSNCHPFRVGGDEQIVLAHNGIIPIDLAKDEKRSDTRVFAEDELPHVLEWLDDPEGWNVLEDYVGWSKVAIFSISPRLKNNIYILNESMGDWDNGIWWSNDSHKPPKHKYWKSYSWDDDYEDDSPTRPLALTARPSTSKMTEWWKRSDVQQCLYCNYMLDTLEWEYGYCNYCKSCLECANDIIDCDCDRGELLPTWDLSKRTYRHWWEDAEEGTVIG